MTYKLCCIIILKSTNIIKVKQLPSFKLIIIIKLNLKVDDIIVLILR